MALSTASTAVASSATLLNPDAYLPGPSSVGSAYPVTLVSSSSGSDCPTSPTTTFATNDGTLRRDGGQVHSSPLPRSCSDSDNSSFSEGSSDAAGRERSRGRRPRSGRGTGSCKDWCFTLNNPTAQETEAYRAHLSGPRVRYACFQREMGSLGTPHLQGYFELRRARALSSVRLMFPRIHAEPRRGTRDQARDYCRKSATAVAGTWEEFGDWEAGGQGARNDIRAVAEFLKTGTVPEAIHLYPVLYARHPRFMEGFKAALIAREPRHWLTKVFVFVGPPGIGKTRLAHKLWPGLWTKPPGANSGVWFNTYEGQRNVLLDDFRGSDIPFEFLLQLLDRFPLAVPTKGSFAPFVPWTVCITTNLEPEQWYFRGDPEQCTPLLRRIHHRYSFPISAVDSAQLAQLAKYGSPGGPALVLND